MENSRLHETQNPEKNNNKKVAATTAITRTISQRKKDNNTHLSIFGMISLNCKIKD